MDEETIVISFEKNREIIYRSFKTDNSIKYEYFWDEIGLKRIDPFRNSGVYFKVINKKKLVHGMIKYGFTI